MEKIGNKYKQYLNYLRFSDYVKLILKSLDYLKVMLIDSKERNNKISLKMNRSKTKNNHKNR